MKHRKKKVNCFTFLDVEPNSDVRQHHSKESSSEKYESKLNCRVCASITPKVQKTKKVLSIEPL